MVTNKKHEALVNGYTDLEDTLIAAEKRGDTYRARAVALYKKLKHDGLTEKEAESYIEMMQDHIWKMMDEAGIPRQIEIDSFGKKYRAFDSFAGRLEKYGQLLAAERQRTARAESDLAQLRSIEQATRKYMALLAGYRAHEFESLTPLALAEAEIAAALSPRSPAADDAVGGTEGRE
jgi:hypothetical protein